MEKYVGSLSTHNVAVMIHVLSLRNRYRSAAAASSDMYKVVNEVLEDIKRAADVVNKVLEDMSVRHQLAKELQDHCVGEWTKFETYADNFMSSPAHRVQGEDLPLACQRWPMTARLQSRATWCEFTEELAAHNSRFVVRLRN
jgi:hypothetical protein